jgi:hypothetical protein
MLLLSDQLVAVAFDQLDDLFLHGGMGCNMSP